MVVIWTPQWAQRKHCGWNFFSCAMTKRSGIICPQPAQYSGCKENQLERYTVHY